MKEFWNQRYGQEAYAYGKQPNQFFKEQLAQIPVGRILLPAEGEGRNAVYAATLGWEVVAFDQSVAGKKKAEELARTSGVMVNYQVGALDDLKFEEHSFDAVGLIFSHFPAILKRRYNQLFSSFLKPGGTIILECFSKSHLPFRERNPSVGGPGDLDILFSIEEIKTYFEHYNVLILREKIIELAEGLYHNGLGSVVRFVGRKPEFPRQ